MNLRIASTEPYADILDRAARQSQRALRRSILGHQEALQELWEVWNECRNPGWDGYGALPVERETLRAAYIVIESLPLGFPRPTIGAEPDGQLTLEWRRSPVRVLSVSIDAGGFLHFAGLYGASKRYGTLAFFSSAPSELLHLVRDL